MADPAVAFHTAQEATLRGSAALAALFAPALARVYSVVPQNAPLPFIRIGDDQILEDSDECVSGSEIFALVHVWTRPDPPDVQLGRQMAGVIRAALTADDLEIAGFEMILGEFQDARHLTDPDGSSHAVIAFR